MILSKSIVSLNLNVLKTNKTLLMEKSVILRRGGNVWNQKDRERERVEFDFIYETFIFISIKYGLQHLPVARNLFLKEIY